MYDHVISVISFNATDVILTCGSFTDLAASKYHFSFLSNSVPSFFRNSNISAVLPDIERW